MIEHIAIISLIIFAIWYTMLEGEIFGSLGRWFERTLPGWIQQPLHECPVCMAPYYGTAIYWLAFGVNVRDWLLTVIPAMGLNVVVMRLWPKDEITVHNDY